MQINTRNPMSGARASYSRNSQVLAEQAIKRGEDWQDSKSSLSREWGTANIDSVIRSSSDSTLSYVKDAQGSSSTEKAIASIALASTKPMTANMASLANQANSAALQAIAALQEGLAA